MRCTVGSVFRWLSAARPGAIQFSIDDLRFAIGIFGLGARAKSLLVMELYYAVRGIACSCAECRGAGGNLGSISYLVKREAYLVVSGW